jgi:hypothetical protein
LGEWGPLAGPEAKLDRAIEQLETVKAQAERFVETQPYTVAVQYEAKAGCFVTRFWARRAVPLETSILVGEIVHNLRSALEHVAWLLACANTDDVASLWKPETRKLITFPVAKKAEAFVSHSLRPLISAKAEAAIEPLQPYVGRLPEHVENHPLVGLHELWNIDKHRVIHGGIALFDFSGATWQPKAITKEDLDALAEGFDTEIVPREGPLEDGAELAYVRFPALSNPPGTVKVDMEGEISTRIVFGAGGHAISIDGLEGCCTYVSLVLNEVWPMLR